MILKYIIYYCTYNTNNTMILDLKSNSIALDKVLASTNIDAPFGIPGSIKINPRYDLRSNTADATVGYAYRDTSFKVDAQQKRLTVAHIFGRNHLNQIVPTVTTGGDFSVSYSRELQGEHAGGRVTTTWTPDDSIAVQWDRCCR